MDTDKLLQHFDKKIDEVRADNRRIEDKLDSHMERISAAETSIIWIKGAITFGNGILLAVVSGLIGLFYKILAK